MSRGVLYLCATPIGNLGDISERALETLRSVDRIACEDTRHSMGLFSHFGISKPLISYHEHNKYERAEELVSLLLAGENIALVTDAGTPVISDPGEVLVQEAKKAGILVTSLPGPCALITALTLSGIPARRFVFEGFLPQESKERKAVLQDLKEERRTVVLYEAPHRLRKTLEELANALGEERPVCLCRELTKLHEEAVNMRLSEAMALYRETEPRGEYVLVLAGKSEERLQAEKQESWESKSVMQHLADFMETGLDKKAAMKAMAEAFGKPKREIYDAILKEKEP